MKLPFFDEKEIFSLLRITCGTHILLQQLFVQWPRFSEFYGSQGMVNPDLFQFYVRSPLFYIWDQDGLKWVIFIIGIACAIFFTFGIFARYFHLPLFLVLLAFQLANPMVIHEPQQLVQLLLLILWLVPYESHFTIRKSPGFSTYEFLSENSGRSMIFVLQFFLAYYYLLAGLKKLPDPLWRSGAAVEVFLNSPYLARDWKFVGWIAHSPLTIVATYAVLIFEIGFIVLIFTGYRKILLMSGVLFHALIALTMDVGLFWAALLMWYPVLLFKKDAKTPLAL